MINLEWVKDYIDLSDQDLKQLAVEITKAGINVERVITNHIDHLTIGEIIDCIPHPDSDHLKICQVKISNDLNTQIVCGAPNARKGIKVIVALPNAQLPGDFKIKKSKIRGIESNGMMCALYELGLEENNEENYAKGICELDEEAKVGEDPLEFLNLSDTLYELDIHKHRNNDCYYHIGFAYEIAAILNRKVILPDDSYIEKNDSINNYFDLEVQSQKCPYYTAKMVRNVKIGESPEFIKKRLLSVGMRPINNVVDISNYVMLEYGQPLHFFDKNKLGDHILVRNAKEGEKIITLDAKKRTLTSNDIVITNGKDPVCIAGVMGGENTEVDEHTTDILIEAAIFDPVSIRYTATRLNLRSEASIRYGKGLNDEYTDKALDRACYLLQKYANAEVLEDRVIYDKVDKKDKVIEFYKEDVNQLLGITIEEEEMKNELERIGFSYQLEKGKFTVTVPKRRLDIEPYVNDIAEEIGRLYGYHNLVSTLPKVPIKKGEYIGDVKYRKEISKRLRRLGLTEVKTYTLVSPDMAKRFDDEKKEKVILPNPMSVDKSICRTTLIPSLLEVYHYNKKRKVKDICIYEIAKTYDRFYHEESKICGLLSGSFISNGWNLDKKIDFYIVKGIVENLLDYMGFKNRYSFDPSSLSVDLHPKMSANILLDRKKIGLIGRVHPSICKEEVYVFELSLQALMNKIKPLKYKEAPKYPKIEKDAAFILDKNISALEVENTIKKSSSRILKNIHIFDVYTGDKIDKDKKSIAFNLVFMDENKTLTDEEVTIEFNQIISSVCEKHHAKLRDK